MSEPDDIDYLDGEDIRCLGMWRADRQRLFPLADETFAASPKPPKPRKTPKPTIERIAKDARKAGLTIASIEVKADGSFTIATSNESAARAAENPWRAEFQRKESKK
jgi:hypothetical protein